MWRHSHKPVWPGKVIDKRHDSPSRVVPLLPRRLWYFWSGNARYYSYIRYIIPWAMVPFCHRDKAYISPWLTMMCVKIVVTINLHIKFTLIVFLSFWKCSLYSAAFGLNHGEFALCCLSVFLYFTLDTSAVCSIKTPKSLLPDQIKKIKNT